MIRPWPTAVCGPRCFSEHLGCGPKAAGAHNASTSTNPCGTFGVHDRLKPTKHRQAQIVGTLSESQNLRGPRTLTYLQMLASGLQETSGSINHGATLGPRASVVRRLDVHESFWHVPGILEARCCPQACGVRPTCVCRTRSLCVHESLGHIGNSPASGNHAWFCDSVLEHEVCERSWPMVALVFCF